MILKTWQTLVAVVTILLVGCGASAAPTEDSSVIGDNPQVVAQAQRIDELEARLDALQWTEQDAIAVVQSKLREHLVACSGEGGCTLPGSPRSFGGFESDGSATDPVLQAVPSLSGIGWNIVGRFALDRGEWAAIHEPSALRWRVESVIRFPDNVVQIGFYAYEKTGLVEGIDSYEERFREFNPEQYQKQFGIPPK